MPDAKHGAKGKDAITIRQLLRHEAGCPADLLGSARGMEMAYAMVQAAEAAG